MDELLVVLVAVDWVVEDTGFVVVVVVRDVVVEVAPGQLAGKFERPPLTYRLNCFGPPHFAVPVVLAPILPLQISVQALAPVRLVTAEPWKENAEPP